MRWGGMVDGMSRWEGLVHACSSMCAHVMHDGELWVGHGVCFAGSCSWQQVIGHMRCSAGDFNFGRGGGA